METRFDAISSDHHWNHAKILEYTPTFMGKVQLMEISTYETYNGEKELTLQEGGNYITFYKDMIEYCAEGYGQGYMAVGDEARRLYPSKDQIKRLIEFLQEIVKDE